jgi:hypothetical protein
MMREKLLHNLNAVFSDRNPLLVSDNQELVTWLTKQDIHAVTFASLLANDVDIPQKVFIIPLDWEQLPSRQTLRKLFAQASVLWLPLASFSSDLSTAKYAIERFSEVDIAHAVALNRRIATQLLLAHEKISISGPDTSLTIRLPDSLQLLCRTRSALLPDEHATMGNYFEVAMSPTDLAGQVDTALSVSGTFRIDAVLVAKHRELKEGMAESFVQANQIADEIRKACPLQVTVQDNRIVAGLEPWNQGLATVVGPDHSALTEVAFGTGLLPLDQVNWNLNCVLNEGAAGIHIGIGNALTGMHFDFIAIEAQLDGLHSTHLDTPNTIRTIDSIHLHNLNNGDAIVIDDRTLTTTHVNKAAHVILQALQQPCTQESLIKTLADAALCDTEEARAPVEQMLGQLDQLGWLTPIQ